MSGGKFSRLPAAAVFDPNIKAGPLRVLAALGTYADPQGNCHPSIVTLARRLNITRRMVQLHLRTLEEAGYLVTATRARVIAGKGINSYQIQYPPVPDDAKPDFASDDHGEANPRFASDAANPETVTRNPAHGDAKFSDGDAKSYVAVTRSPASHKLSHGTIPSEAAQESAQGSCHEENVSGKNSVGNTQPGQARPALRAPDVLKGNGGGSPRRLTPGMDPVTARRALISRIDRVWNLNGITAIDVLNCLPVEIERPLYAAEADGTATDEAVSAVLNSARGQEAIRTAERLAQAQRGQDAQ
jgi:hypothetical protein